MSALAFFVDGHSQTAGRKRAVPILKGEPKGVDRASR
jgi:hypothetical protein